ncbi:shikimate dehydrogenase [Phaeobacter gallaeciensis]|jgi:shikimate dehydrogenase|uniref:Shikimate dehydrogenase (NADP(+)) n=1 Tax=Phaeobacter gallaeciensis TaxID=60890 RepID=A0A1B0ZSJ4_9RHOB|nr:MULTISPECIES: shikimate dehydrogenase [Phaeobacter]MDF1772919.1 shikimate dehydrogenase [Pseudophaeobacter sp. bin_em_oilr2.035]MEE2633308.1 shikimate dehydrogenase [Pseudomonadota bacterium]ANP37141.1 shikimate dehydrogenase [Phaeobacter gallaeciensis]MDE4061131.1 shikimate dehydrogenase [Phaeobacter gallaeciensis]MDE4098079.1 shikimate dehydrogenase [Phaeobacter gallaeciensis]
MNAVKIPLAGVIGCPVAHSRSPQIQNHWLRKYGIAGHYVPMHVEPQDLETVIRALPKAGFVGANVTLPHKETVMTIADKVTDRATLMGAANTLIFREDGSVLADNTDGYGFITNLHQGAPDWKPDAGPAVVLGAGGACRAVVASLIEAGVTEIMLTNRTRERADKLHKEFGKRIKVVDWVLAGNIVEEAALVVNTTSLGMEGKPRLRVPMDGLRPGCVVTDLVYTPLKTDMLQAAEDAGCTVVDGLGMLLHQAVPGFERWFGKRPEVDEETRAAALA